MRTINLEGENTERSLMVLHSIVGLAPEGGYSLADVRTSIKIMDAVEAARQAGESRLSLEDAHWSFLVGRINKGAFTAADRLLLSTCDAVLNASEAAAA